MAASSKQQKLDTKRQKLDTFFTIELQAKSSTLTPNSNTTSSKCSNKRIQIDLDNDESSISIPSSDMVSVRYVDGAPYNIGNYTDHRLVINN